MDYLKKQSKVVIICIVIGVTLILSIFALLLENKNTAVPFNFAFPPTPTPIPQEVKIINQSLQNNTTSNSVFPDVSITFSRPLTSSEQAASHIILSPAAQGDEVWSNNNQILTFTPTLPLTTQQTYTASVASPAGPYSWNFTTVASDSISNDDYHKMQALDDAAFTKNQQVIPTTYPWFAKQPIDGQDYHIYFDLTAKAFIVSLYTSTPQDSQQVNQLKSTALQQLQTTIPEANRYPVQTQIITK